MGRISLNELERERRKLINDFDRVVFTTATVSLGLTVSIVSIGGFDNLGGDTKMLFYAWVAFGLVIVFHLFSYLLAEVSYWRRITLQERDPENDGDNDTIAESAEDISMWLDYIAIVLATVGVILLIFFGKSAIS